MHDDDGKKSISGGGNIIGIGYVSGVCCLVSASDSVIKGGSICLMGLEKSLRAQQIVLENWLPVVSLVESSGANLLYQSEIFVNGGQVFCNMAQISTARILQITVVHGSSTTGGAYMPSLSDYVVVVRKRAKIFLARPPLVKVAIGEDASDEELGGAQMHSEVTGTAEYLAEDDSQAIALARDIISRLGWDEDKPQALEPGYAEPVYNT
jgi:geranyl-CoA carboxylase beta subunit